jgi:phospholipid/cholesterol/gamma-HCH transport system substrate-binding protein
VLTVLTRVKVGVFVVLGVLVIVYIGYDYANVGRFFGASGSYPVTVQLASAGGLYQNADVTYRGVSVGRVGSLALDGSGVEATLNISDSAPKIPADSEAVVADLSAIGEQYIDLRPRTDTGPYLTANDVIQQRDTTVPAPVTDVLESLDSLANSLPRKNLQILVNELYNAFSNQGTNLSILLNAASSYTSQASSYVVPTTKLIQEGQSVLATQQQETSAIESFATTSSQLAAQLASSDSDLRRLISAAPQAATQVTELLRDNDPDLGLLLANLVTAADVAAPRQPALQELLSVLPAAVAAGNTVITPQGANLGLALTFFNPLPCTQGYGGTPYQNGLTETQGTRLNLGAGCTEPASAGNVRGAQHAPSP